MRWKNHIKPSIVSNEFYSMLDIYPTIASIAKTPLPKDRIYDGVDILPSLYERNLTMNIELKENYKKREFLAHYCGSTITAARYNNYKVHYFTAKWEEGHKCCPSVLICPCKGKLNIKKRS